MGAYPPSSTIRQMTLCFGKHLPGCLMLSQGCNLTSCLCRESDAILVYLVERYDTEHKISVSDPKEKITQLQWLFFQSSGQGYVLQSKPSTQRH